LRVRAALVGTEQASMDAVDISMALITHQSKASMFFRMQDWVHYSV
jgi:hypothetical protein